MRNGQELAQARAPLPCDRPACNGHACGRRRVSGRRVPPPQAWLLSVGESPNAQGRPHPLIAAATRLYPSTPPAAAQDGAAPSPLLTDLLQLSVLHARASVAPAPAAKLHLAPAPVMLGGVVQARDGHARHVTAM